MGDGEGEEEAARRAGWMLRRGAGRGAARGAGLAARAGGGMEACAGAWKEGLFKAGKEGAGADWSRMDALVAPDFRFVRPTGNPLSLDGFKTMMASPGMSSSSDTRTLMLLLGPTIAPLGMADKSLTS